MDDDRARSHTPGVVLDSRVGPHHGRIDEDRVRRFARATRDLSPLARSGSAVPLVTVVTHIWDAQTTARSALIPVSLQQAATGGVHGEHDIVLHRPIVPGESLRTWAEGWGSRPVGRNALVTLRYVTVDADDVVVAEQWWTTVYLETTCDRVGEAAPEHTFPDEARASPVGTFEVEVDSEMARRYAEVSGDWSAHHFDVEAARRSGSDRPFLHGVCTMALCATGIVDLLCAGDPERLGRLAIRFATPMPVGERLQVQLYAIDSDTYAFEAECGGVAVTTHGRAEVRG